MKILFTISVILLSQNLIAQDEDKGFDKAYEIMNAIKQKDYRTIKDYFYTSISEKISDNALQMYVDQAAELIEEFGIPNKDKILTQIIFSQINEPTITKKKTLLLCTMVFPCHYQKERDPQLE